MEINQGMPVLVAVIEVIVINPPASFQKFLNQYVQCGRIGIYASIVAHVGGDFFW